MIRGGALGDFIVTLPPLALLRQTFPNAQIELLGQPIPASVALHRSYLNAVHPLDSARWIPFFHPTIPLPEIDRQFFQSFDLILSFLSDPEGIFHQRLHECPVKKILRHPPHPANEPAFLHFSKILHPLGISLPPLPPKIHLLPEDEREADLFLKTIPRRFLAFHPGSGSPLKNWPLENWKKLLKELYREGIESFVGIIGEAESSDSLQRVFQELPILWAKSLPLPTLAAILQRSSGYFGHDSGIAHLARSVETPTLAIWGPHSDPRVWAPPGAIIIRGNPWPNVDAVLSHWQKTQ